MRRRVLAQCGRVGAVHVPRAVQMVGVPPWDQVDVQMEDVLPARGPVRLEQRHAVRAQDTVEDRGHTVGRTHHRCRVVLGDRPDVRRVVSGDDEGVALHDRGVVEEGDGPLVLEEDLRVQPAKRAGADLAGGFLDGSQLLCSSVYSQRHSSGPAVRASMTR